MDSVCLGAYATLAEAEEALGVRPEPTEQLVVVEDGDASAPFRIWWNRAG